MNRNPQNNGLILDYQKLISSKKILPDAAQKLVVDALGILSTEIEGYFAAKAKLFSKIGISKPEKPKGLYIYGGVGRGKSMLMDLFYDNLSKNIPSLRTHFHAFMSDVQTRIKEWHDKNDGSDDVIKYVADEITKEAKVLCFDEMQINDIADAMIVGRLFEALFANDVIIVATSNRHPDDLYKNGLQRDRVIPFIEMFKRELDIMELKSDKDYRLQHINSLEQTYFYPLGEKAHKFIHDAYYKLAGEDSGKPKTIEVRGRKIAALKSHGDIGFFTFKALCDAALGSEDYIEIARQFSTVFIENIPEMKKEDYNLSIRFRHLIDELYNHNCKLICTADASPQKLYVEGEQAFEFERTVSRLIEMQSDEYLRAEHMA